jgi:hypothetical protein
VLRGTTTDLKVCEIRGYLGGDLKNAVSSNVRSYRLVDIYRHFGEVSVKFK